MKKNESLKLDDAGRRRKEYRTPSVKPFGNIRDITQTVGKTGTADGVAAKTSP